ncbi:MAG TPA: class I SAM-dependent methyltransferase [Stellaceae bacterium]|jgi:SAM-dependent methyltransferase|nr:class I SAM-dependent methyltransferase [Stellaceae bacterium]
MQDEVWRTANRANWDERVEIHLAACNLAPLRAGNGRLNAIEEAELGPVAGLRVLHPQCHFGVDSLILAQRGASIVGLDFSAPAIAVARRLAAELGLDARARFVEADLYEAPATIPERASFDLAYVTWGAITWLPDIRRWAGIVADFLKPGGALYLAEAHPAALVLDDRAPSAGGMPGYYAPYFARAPLLIEEEFDYADETARLRNATTYTWLHPLGDILGALRDAGLRLDWLHEHDRVAWRMFRQLVRDRDGMYRWPDEAWLPLAFSLRAERP